MKTISIYRRTGVISDCGAVSAVGRVLAFLARGSVTAIGSTPVLALELALSSAPTKPVGTGVRLGRFTGEEMRTRNKVATADRLAEGGWGFALCELC